MREVDVNFFEPYEKKIDKNKLERTFSNNEKFPAVFFQFLSI